MMTIHNHSQKSCISYMNNNRLGENCESIWHTSTIVESFVLFFEAISFQGTEEDNSWAGVLSED